MASILSSWRLPGVGSLGGPFIGGVEQAVLGTGVGSINTSTVGVYSQSGASITGTSTQTTLVVSGNNDTITSPATGVHVEVSGSNDTVDASGAGATLTANGQSDQLTGTGGGDQFLLTGSGTETGAAMAAGNQFILSTSSGATSGVTIDGFRTGLDQVDVSVTLRLSDPSVRSYGLTPSSVISSDQFFANPNGSAAMTTSQRFVYDQANGGLYFDPNGSASSQSILIGQFHGGAPSAGDIHILNKF
jgi:hypothetical protein